VFAGYEPHALQLLAYLANRSKDPEKRAKVEGFLDQALAAARANPDTPPGRKALALRDVGLFRLSRKKDGMTTAPLFAESGQLFAKSSGPTDLRVAEALAYQALALRIQGKTHETEALREQAAAIERQHSKEQSLLATAVRHALMGGIPDWH
jgi:hypothetical protein